MSHSPSPSSPHLCPVCSFPLPSSANGLCPRCLMAEAARAPQGLSGSPSQKHPTLEEVATAFPQIEVIEFIGAGGMGSVWRARQPKLNRYVALKLLPETLVASDPAFAERFEREGQLLARLHHPNIVTVHDSGRAEKFFYLIMELVDGVNLRQAMHASLFTSAQALAIVPKICDALQYAHEEGVLHRDIKPENILLDSRGRVKLVDFGIAKLIAQPEAPVSSGAPEPSPLSPDSLTLVNTTLGTPDYMAPEQMTEPAEVDHRADIYSLGVVFYELLTGELPLGKFSAPSAKASSDPRLDGVVRQALEREREHRQQSAGEMRTQVETIAATIPAQRPSPPPPQPTLPDERKATRDPVSILGRVRFVALLALDIVLALALVLAGWTARRLGVFFNAVFMFLLLMVLVRGVMILTQFVQHTLQFPFWKTRSHLLRYGGQVINHWLFWIAAFVTLKTCVVPAQFSDEQYLVVHILYGSLVVVLLLLELLPSRRILVATNLAFAVGWIFMWSELATVYSPTPPSEGVVLSAPFHDDWLVVHGGDSFLVNNHHDYPQQRDALDIERVVNGKELTGSRTELTSYPSWGQTLEAPADGKLSKW